MIQNIHSYTAKLAKQANRSSTFTQETVKEQTNEYTRTTRIQPTDQWLLQYSAKNSYKLRQKRTTTLSPMPNMTYPEGIPSQAPHNELPSWNERAAAGNYQQNHVHKSANQSNIIRDCLGLQYKKTEIKYCLQYSRQQLTPMGFGNQTSLASSSYNCYPRETTKPAKYASSKESAYRT
ncbi:13517_t:CDS:2 [Ambispora leptoticha]|uniref:13517_t:CDS:1 n=1 Tax=Ambispora leptoticha TaxID=144679 RepID=A0A9N9EJ61_9GLOM|nr:13517_t:CDS:2 [Ambispora leptoticha]